MNIFYLDETPHIAAHYHHYNHASKMILESAQLLCTAHRLLDGKRTDNMFAGKAGRYYLEDPRKDGLFYKQTHEHHPCTKWVMESRQHYNWVWSLFYSLGQRFKEQRGKQHLSWNKLVVPLSTPPANIPNKQFVDPPMVMDEKYIINNACYVGRLSLNRTVASYRNYYANTKLFSHWEHGDRPWWIRHYTSIGTQVKIKQNKLGI